MSPVRVFRGKSTNDQRAAEKNWVCQSGRTSSYEPELKASIDPGFATSYGWSGLASSDLRAEGCGLWICGQWRRQRHRRAEELGNCVGLDLPRPMGEPS